MAKPPMKSRLHDLYLLGHGWSPAYHPTACYYCGRLIMQADVVEVCDASGIPTLQQSTAGEWFTVDGNVFNGSSTRCARFRGKDARPHVPVVLERCETCGAWCPPEGTDVADPGRHAGYEKASR